MRRAEHGLFALELDRPCARPAFVFDGPSHRLDGHLKLVKVFNRRRPHGIILSRQCLPQLGDSALKNTKILVWVHCHALHPAIGLWPKGGATIMRPITEECEAAYILLGSLPTGPRTLRQKNDSLAESPHGAPAPEHNHLPIPNAAAL